MPTRNSTQVGRSGTGAQTPGIEGNGRTKANIELGTAISDANRRYPRSITVAVFGGVRRGPVPDPSPI
jgi:hypothetical protein